MPSPSEILGSLTYYTVNPWSEVAVGWHVAVAGLLAALILGWRSTHRQWSLILSIPLVSISVFAWLTQNRFNGTLFALGAVASSIIGARLPSIPAPRASIAVAMLGFGMIAFGWVSPHFLEGGSTVRDLFAAPTGLVPCPTLSVVV